MSEDGKFFYNYKASQKDEIEEIRAKYEVKEKPARDEKLDLLRRIDAKVNMKSTVCAVLCGLIGSLIFGGGLSLVLLAENYFVGVPLGILGIALMTFALKVKSIVLKKERAKNAKKIIELSDELLGK